MQEQGLRMFVYSNFQVEAAYQMVMARLKKRKSVQLKNHDIVILQLSLWKGPELSPASLDKLL